MKLLILLTFTIFVIAIEGTLSKRGRIVGGEEAVPGQFPWQVALYLDDTDFCDGILISEEWILTSADCANNRTSVVAVLGITNLANVVVGYHISKTVLHEDYVNGRLAHDIALLKLSEPIEITDNIRPVMIDGNTLHEDVDVIVSGFGKLNDSDTDNSDTLQWVNVTTISNEECSNYYIAILEEHVCTLSSDSGISQGICEGDIGGPVVTYVGNRPLLVAISSGRSGYGCEEGYPSIFTRTKPYLEWIAIKINSE